MNREATGSREAAEMATRTCPDCGAQYVATVRRCIDCDAMLVDKAGPEADGGEAGPSSGSPVGTGEQIGYELEGWGNQLKVTLEGMLARAGIGRVWEAGALVVSVADEEAVDDLIATLEGDDMPELDDETPRVALEIEGMDADDQAELDAQLAAGSVPHAWDDEGALIVAQADEDQVLELIDEVLSGPPDEGDGLAAQEAMSALYVAVDRLVKNPHDRKLATAYVRSAALLDDIDVPYGFAASEWSDLAAEAARLADDVAGHADRSPEPVADADKDTDDDVGPTSAADDEDVAAENVEAADDDVTAGDDRSSGDGGEDDDAASGDHDSPEPPVATEDSDSSLADDRADDPSDDGDADTHGGAGPASGDLDDDTPDGGDEPGSTGDMDAVEQAREAARHLRSRLTDLV